MKIEDEIKSTIPLDNSKKIITAFEEKLKNNTLL